MALTEIHNELICGLRVPPSASPKDTATSDLNYFQSKFCSCTGSSSNLPCKLAAGAPTETSAVAASAAAAASASEASFVSAWHRPDEPAEWEAPGLPD